LAERRFSTVGVTSSVDHGVFGFLWNFPVQNFGQSIKCGHLFLFSPPLQAHPVGVRTPPVPGHAAYAGSYNRRTHVPTRSVRKVSNKRGNPQMNPPPTGPRRCRADGKRTREKMSAAARLRQS